MKINPKMIENKAHHVKYYYQPFHVGLGSEVGSILDISGKSFN